VLVRAAARGPLVGSPLLGVVHRIASEAATGALHLVGDGRRKKIYFVDGRPEFVASTDTTEMLGEFLVATGRCMRMEIDMALALLPRYGGRLGDALVGLGVMRPVELFQAVSEQVRGRYLEAFRWDRGEWAFIEGDRSGEEVFPFAHDARELLRDAARAADPERLAAMHAPLAQQPLVRVASPPAPRSAYRLPAAWERVLDFPDGRTVREILDRERPRGASAVDEAHRALHLALSCDIVRPESQA
jgi:serine/threonine-protein kinase